MRALQHLPKIRDNRSGCGEHSERYCSVKKYIGCDSHARYSVFVSVDETGKASAPERVDHQARDLRITRKRPGEPGEAVLTGG